MIIKKLSIKGRNTDKTYVFDKGMNLIYSRENTTGKTTMMRFILHALGYQIPETEGIGSFSKFTTIIELETKNDLIVIERKGENAKLFIGDKCHEFFLPLQEKEMLIKIFSIREPDVLTNLLGVFYIDQEKGWTMLNRGKVIGNIRFNIENFIAGLTGKNICDLIKEKKTIGESLRKYRLISKLIDVDNVDNLKKDSDNYMPTNFSELQARKDAIEADNYRISKKIKIIRETAKSNEGLAELIYDLGLVVVYNNERMRITNKNLLEFDTNQELLKKRQRSYEIKKKRNEVELDLIQKQLDEQNSLFEFRSIIQEFEETMQRYPINNDLLNNIMGQMETKRKNVNLDIKDRLMEGNILLQNMFETIRDYATRLGVVEYVPMNGPEFVLTNKLKVLSGRILAQLAFVFRLAYIKAIKNKYNIILPIIIDSPRAAELSPKSTSGIFEILRNDFSDHQIILASIYKTDVSGFHIIDLNNGFLDFLNNSDLPLLAKSRFSDQG